MKSISIGIVSLGLLLNLNCKAQEKTSTSNGSSDYSNAIGLRFGLTSGITFKHRFNQTNAFEAILSAWPYNLGVTGLYERYIPTGVEGLNCYLGGGGHLSVGGPNRVVYGYYGERRYSYIYTNGRNALGVDGILGIEYKFKPLPIALSADFKPFFEINNYGYSYISVDPSLGVKITF
jgi:hypothetical protein